MNVTQVPIEAIAALFEPIMQQFESWGWSFFMPTKVIEDGLSISIRTTRANIPTGTTYLDINILKDVFYLLHIELRKEDRGKGYGGKLYEMLTEVAHQLGCRRIEQTPSGWTPSGDTRASYLQRRGWILENNVAYKDL